jgi:HipA-like protein
MSWKARFSTPPPRIEVLFHGEAVAELSRGRDGKYLFRYLPAFIEKKLFPFPGLPLSGKDHVSQELFPFFKERVPDLSRPEILHWLRNHSVQTDDQMALLGTLGKKSVTDSFELRWTTAA